MAASSLEALAVIQILFVWERQPVLLAEARVVLIQLVDEVEIVAADLHQCNRRAKVFTEFRVADIPCEAAFFICSSRRRSPDQPLR